MNISYSVGLFLDHEHFLQSGLVPFSIPIKQDEQYSGTLFSAKIILIVFRYFFVRIELGYVDIDM